MTVLEYLAGQPVAFIIVAAILGLLIGSFLNVVIYRLPVMMEHSWQRECAELQGSEIAAPGAEPFNLVTPRSRCPACGHAITAVENIPLLSFLVLRGKCRACAAPISPRYPAIELVTGVMTAFVAWHFGFGWAAAGAMLLTWALISLTVIDYDHQLLPDQITLPCLWVGLLLSSFHLYTVNPVDNIIGAVAGYLSLWSIYQLFRLVTGKEGMGYGDFKLLALLGAWLGWQALPVVILMSSLVGAVVGVGLIAFRGRDRSHAIPFGPYLAAAGWITLLWGDQISTTYLNWALGQ